MSDLVRKGIGTMEAGKLVLTPVETAYAVGAGWLKGSPKDAIAAADEAEFLVYQDIRDRGLVIAPDGDAYTVWKRGEGRGHDPWFALHVCHERTPTNLATLASWAGHLVAVVDDDSVVTYYSVDAIHPEGQATPQLRKREGVPSGNHVRVPGQADDWIAQGFGAARAGDTWLNVVEANHLAAIGVLASPPLPTPENPHLQAVYDDLRGRGVVVRSGFRFGTHLRGYEGHMDDGHANWIIDAYGRDDALAWSRLSRGIRLAHGVRKSYVLATHDPIAYVTLAWFKP